MFSKLRCWKRGYHLYPSSTLILNINDKVGLYQCKCGKVDVDIESSFKVRREKKILRRISDYD